MNAKHILTILAVENLEQSVDFYVQAFRWPKRVDAPVYVEFELPDGRGLGLYDREAFASNTGRPPQRIVQGELAPTELYFHCDDLTPALERMHEAGAWVLSPLAPRDWGDEAAYFADPDGNVIVLARALRSTSE
ncbi:MAG: VOC family protein [Planctomycetota bacterium]|jgi:predicted enzyme related to lactoylglutathione lyase